MGEGLGRFGDLALAIVLVVLQLLFHINIAEVSEDLRTLSSLTFHSFKKSPLSL